MNEELFNDIKAVFDMDIAPIDRQKLLLQVKVKFENKGMPDIQNQYRIGLVSVVCSNRPLYRPRYIQLIHELFKDCPETLKIFKKHEENPLFPNLELY